MRYLVISNVAGYQFKIQKSARNITILLLPFLIMIGINEVIRTTIKEKPYKKFGITAINSIDRLENKCTWICHNNTKYCKEKHVKISKKYFTLTDHFYFGLIKLLNATGNYGLANIIFLVLLLPFTIWYFLIKSLNIRDEIKLNSKKNESTY